nr:hypothetical protein [Tanacetum cinerariifolium]
MVVRVLINPSKVTVGSSNHGQAFAATKNTPVVFGESIHANELMMNPSNMSTGTYDHVNYPSLDSQLNINDNKNVELVNDTTLNVGSLVHDDDQIGVSFLAGQISKVSNVALTIGSETLIKTLNRYRVDNGNKLSPNSVSFWSTGVRQTCIGESIFGSKPPSGNVGSNLVGSDKNKPAGLNVSTSLESNMSNGDGNDYTHPTKWSVNASLQKEEMSRIPIWVKLHDVPIQVFKEDGISLIATYLEKPIMLDSYTTSICKESWGRSSFARSLIEINSEAEFKEFITIVMSKKRNNKKSSAANTIPRGVPVAKGFQVGKQFNYQPKAPNTDSNGGGTWDEASSKAGTSSYSNKVNRLGEKILEIFITPLSMASLSFCLSTEVSLLAYVAPLLEYEDVPALELASSQVCSRWKWISNRSLCNKSSWIILGWNDDLVDVMIMAQTNQVMHAQAMCSLCGFNAALNIKDHSSGGYEPNAVMRDFKECVQAMEVADVVKQLKGMKYLFRKLLHNHGNLHEQVNKIRIELDEAQKAIDKDPSSSILHEDHAHYLLAFKEAKLDEERFLKQKAKVEWLKAGDANTTYFHKIVKSKYPLNMIKMVSDSFNNFHDGNQVPGAFVNHYNQFLGAEGVTHPLNDHDLFIRVIDNSKADCMVCDVTVTEEPQRIWPRPPGHMPRWIPVSFGNVHVPPRGCDGAPAKANGSGSLTSSGTPSDIKILESKQSCIAARLFPPREQPEGRSVVKQLKGMKYLFRKLLHNHGNLHERVNNIRIELDEAQKAIDKDPSSSILHEDHAHYLLAFKEAKLDEERFLKQKAKVEWLKAGDANTTYFHKIVKSKYPLNMIKMVSDSFNNFHDGNQVPGAFVNHYNQFLGAEGVTHPLNDHDLFIRVIDNSKADCMVCDVTGLGDIVSINQSASVPGSRISDNILLTQELKRNYHRRRGPPSSISVIMNALEEFKQVSGLVPSISKSTTCFCNVPNAIKAFILNFMPFAEGALSVRDIARSGFSLDDSVSNLISDGVWRWPLDWLSRFRFMAQLHVPLLLDDMDDVILWRDMAGVLRPFSMACVWDTIQSKADMMWSKVRVLCGMDAISPRLVDVVAFIVPISKGKTIINILSWIVVAATSYYIWLEKNGRLFKKKTSSPD